MKIVYITTDEPDAALQKIVEENKKNHTVKVINLRKDNNYDEIIETIEQFDRVISW